MAARKKVVKKVVKSKVKAKAKARAVKKSKQMGRPKLPSHVKVMKKLKVGDVVAVSTREGIVGVIAAYSDDGKIASILRGVEKVNTLVGVPTAKLRAATVFEQRAYAHMVDLLSKVADIAGTSMKDIIGLIAEAVDSLEANAAVEVSDEMKIVERAEDVKEAAGSMESALFAVATGKEGNIADLTDAQREQIVTDVLNAG